MRALVEVVVLHTSQNFDLIRQEAITQASVKNKLRYHISLPYKV